MIELDFIGQLNTSLQVGDIVYYLPVTTTASFNTSNTSSAVELGPVTEILVNNFNNFTIRIDSTSGIPAGTNFYMFSKDNTVNLASVLGYHAEVQFVNNSNEKISRQIGCGNILSKSTNKTVKKINELISLFLNSVRWLIKPSSLFVVIFFNFFMIIIGVIA